MKHTLSLNFCNNKKKTKHITTTTTTTKATETESRDILYELVW